MKFIEIKTLRINLDLIVSYQPVDYGDGEGGRKYCILFRYAGGEQHNPTFDVEFYDKQERDHMIDYLDDKSVL